MMMAREVRQLGCVAERAMLANPKVWLSSAHPKPAHQTWDDYGCGRNYAYTIVALTQNNKAWTPTSIAHRAYAPSPN